MPFQLSPGVAVVEKDFSNIVPAVSSSIGAFAGSFPWGPVLEPTTISSENVLVQQFGKPNNSNYSSFFSAANFLSYASNLLLVRADSTTGTNASADGTGIKVKNYDDYLAQYQYGGSAIGEYAAKYPGTLGNSLTVSYADSASFGAWDYKSSFDSAPGTSAFVAGVSGSQDEMHIVVVDTNGVWTGSPGSILEKFAFVSKAGDAKTSDGTNNHYKEVLNIRSKYVWWMEYPVAGTNWGDAAAGTTFVNTTDTLDLLGGVDDYVMTAGQQQAAYALFADADMYDISLIIAGKATAATATIIAGIAQTRGDCVAFISPEEVVTGFIIIGNTSTETDKVIAYRNAVTVAHSYAVMDSGYKYQYDRYNDVYRYIPLNADVAGLCARADFTNDPWWSPGGFNRGQIKNIVRLAHNPDKTNRDTLYKSNVNPVVSFRGQGVVLYGDKTMQTKPSAFDRINVRRLFIVLEKAISTAAKFQLFEFNDGFTRAQFKNTIEPFLRDVQGRRGIVDFRVVCDSTNNTGEVVDRSEFIADIYIKPNHSINYITLNFVAARSSANFTEIGG